MMIVIYAALAAPAVASQEVWGTWRLAEDEASVEQRIEGRIRDLTSRKIWPFSAIARGTLKKAASPCHRVQIGRVGSQIRIQCDDRAPAVAVPDGRTVTYVGHDGRDLELSIDLQDSEELVQTFESRHGTRRNQVELEGPERLAMEVTITASALQEPLTYALHYQRLSD